MKYPTLVEYWDMLDAHDWFFEFSDDKKVWNKGRAQLTKLVEIAEYTDEYYDLYNKFEYYINDKIEGKEAVKPKRPGE